MLVILLLGDCTCSGEVLQIYCFVRFITLRTGEKITKSWEDTWFNEQKNKTRVH